MEIYEAHKLNEQKRDLSDPTLTTLTMEEMVRAPDGVVMTLLNKWKEEGWKNYTQDILPKKNWEKF